MTRILVMCTGNICRSPIAAGLLRHALVARFGESAPEITSAGTAGWEGSGAVAESVQAASERGIDIAGHVARLVTNEMLLQADLIVAMAAEHRLAVIADVPEAEPRTFTLKELVRLLGTLPAADDGAGPDELASRVAQAAAVRSTIPPTDRDEDVADPLGQPINSYRAIAWELDELIARLMDGLFGPLPQGVAETG